jgi:hypothetical protein
VVSVSNIHSLVLNLSLTKLIVIGVAGYLLTLIPVPMQDPPKVGVPIPEEKLRPDAMHID